LSFNPEYLAGWIVGVLLLLVVAYVVLKWVFGPAFKKKKTTG
jgi:hypothetical protein